MVVPANPTAKDTRLVIATAPRSATVAETISTTASATTNPRTSAFATATSTATAKATATTTAIARTTSTASSIAKAIAVGPAKTPPPRCYCSQILFQFNWSLYINSYMGGGGATRWRRVNLKNWKKNPTIQLCEDKLFYHFCEIQIKIITP